MFMANSFPEPGRLGSVSALLMVLLVMSARAESQMTALRKDVPIIIDANSSEFDYASNQLLFHGLRLNQDQLGVQAEFAETDKLDFDDGQWVLTGDVVIETANATLWCDHAVLTFINHQLAIAELNGAPAHFEQTIVETGEMNSGEGNTIVYRLAAGTLRLSENAHFSDGTNQISGDLITYDLQAQHLQVGSGDSGPVKIVIEAPHQQKEKKQTP
jgi:lipopolysaccharide export system protein LptA